MATKIKKEDIILALNKDALLEAFNTSGNPDTIEGFKEFLTSKGFKTEHAKDVYNRLKDSSVSLNITNDEYKMPNKDNRLKTAGKKAGVPALIFGAVVAGITFIAMPLIGLMGGEALANLIPASQNWVIPALAASAITFPIGSVLAFGFLKLKKFFTRRHYNKNNTAKKALKELEKGESLSINELMGKFEKTNAKILELANTKNPFKMLYRHILDKINRNRLHQISKYTKDLAELFYNIDHTESADRDEKLEHLYKLLKDSEDFVLNTSEQLAIFFELTGIKLIRQTDISAKLAKYMNIKVVEGKNLKATEKAVNKEKRKRKQLKGYATNLLNGERFLAKLCERYEANLASSATPAITDDVEETIPASTDEDAPIYEPDGFEDYTDETAPWPAFSFADETPEETAEEVAIEELPTEEAVAESVSDDDAIFDLVDTEIDVVETPSEDDTRLEFEFIPTTYSAEELAMEETTVPTEVDYGYDVEVPYTPVTEKAPVVEETTASTEEGKTPSIIKKCLLKYESKAITYNNETVGAKLKVKTNDSTDTTEIRWIRTGDKIKISENVNGTIETTYVEVTDTTRPPIAQINEILINRAHEQHIDNVDGLTV